MSPRRASRQAWWPIGFLLLAGLVPPGTTRGQDERPDPGRPPRAEDRPRGAEEERRPSDRDERRGRPRRERRAGSADLRRALRDAEREAQILEARLVIKRAEVQRLQAELKLQELGARDGDPDREIGPREDARQERTRADLERAAVPFPDTIVIERPAADAIRSIFEKRIRRSDEDDRPEADPKSKAIRDALDRPVTIPFPDKTSLEDVIKYIRKATQSPDLPDGIPIHVDPTGLREAEVTMESKVSLRSEGVPLKRSLGLILKQVGLSYTIKDGLLMIDTSRGE